MTWACRRRWGWSTKEKSETSAFLDLVRGGSGRCPTGL